MKLKMSLAVSALLMTGVPGAIGIARADIAASWVSPLSGTSFAVGSVVNPTGNANASGTVGGNGLDLALVLDSSGSMGTVSNGQTRRQWLQQASTGLVNALPVASTSVAVVDFDSDALLLTALTPLTTGKATVINGINAIDASGGTNIGAGIDRASQELVGGNHGAGRTQMMVVVSDGMSSGDPPASAANALGVGVDAIHTVGIPGHSVSTMQAIAAAGHGIYTDASDLSALISLFDGTGGNLVGVDHVDVTLNDGTFISRIGTDGLGNFLLPDARIVLGDNIFEATAYDTVGNSATATLTLIGAVPEPSTWLLFMAGTGLLVGLRRRSGSTVHG